MNRIIVVITTLLILLLLCGCHNTALINAVASPQNTVSLAPEPTATVMPTPTPMPTPAPATPIPLTGAPRFSWDQDSIELPQPLYAVYNLKDEPVVNMDNFPALLWDGQEFEIDREDDTGGRYVLHGSPFSNYREELSVVRQNIDSETIGASCRWNWNGKERQFHMFEGTEQDAREAAASYFGNALGSDFMSTLGRIAVDKTLTDERIYTVNLYRSIDGMELERPVINAYITEEGFRYFYLNLADYEGDMSIIIERPLTFEEALYSLNYYYETRIGHPDFLRNYELSDVRLMLSSAFTDEYRRGQLCSTLSPVWVFTLTKDKPDLDMTVEELVLVDVRTGEIYNGSNPGGSEDSPYQDITPR